MTDKSFDKSVRQTLQYDGAHTIIIMLSAGALIQTWIKLKSLGSGGHYLCCDVKPSYVVIVTGRFELFLDESRIQDGTVTQTLLQVSHLHRHHNETSTYFKQKKRNESLKLIDWWKVDKCIIGNWDDGTSLSWETKVKLAHLSGQSRFFHSSTIYNTPTHQHVPMRYCWSRL